MGNANKKPPYPMGYEACWDCRGYGVVEGPGPSVSDCRTCEGDGKVRSRDVRGRFLPTTESDPSEVSHDGA